jgi:hypothetical protein
MNEWNGPIDRHLVHQKLTISLSIYNEAISSNLNEINPWWHTLWSNIVCLNRLSVIELLRVAPMVTHFVEQTHSAGKHHRTTPSDLHVGRTHTGWTHYWNQACYKFGIWFLEPTTLIQNYHVSVSKYITAKSQGRGLGRGNERGKSCYKYGPRRTIDATSDDC